MTTGQDQRSTWDPHDQPQGPPLNMKTPGAKGAKLARFDLLPWGILSELAEHYGRGARKYEDRNWERGYKWSLSFAALHRHLAAFWNRDDIDDDPALYVEGEAHVARHIIAVVWHACCLAYFSRYGVGEDDRSLAHDPYGFKSAGEPWRLPREDGNITQEQSPYTRHFFAAQKRSPTAGERSWHTQAMAELRLGRDGNETP